MTSFLLTSQLDISGLLQLGQAFNMLSVKWEHRGRQSSNSNTGRSSKLAVAAPLITPKRLSLSRLRSRREYPRRSNNKYLTAGPQASSPSPQAYQAPRRAIHTSEGLMRKTSWPVAVFSPRKVPGTRRLIVILLLLLLPVRRVYGLRCC